jgi:hypothetical protein
MLKRIAILAFILSTVVLMAMAPMNGTTASENTRKLQTTVEPTMEVTVEVTVVVETSTPGAAVTATADQGSIPVTGGGGLPMSTLLIFGLVAVLGIAVVIGGMALLSRRNQ